MVNTALNHEFDKADELDGRLQPFFDVEFKGIRVDYPKPEWCPKGTDLNQKLLCIELGEVL